MSNVIREGKTSAGTVKVTEVTITQEISYIEPSKKFKNMIESLILTKLAIADRIKNPDFKLRRVFIQFDIDDEEKSLDLRFDLKEVK